MKYFSKMVPEAEIPIACPEPTPEDDTVSKKDGSLPSQSLESREDGQSIRSLNVKCQSGEFNTDSQSIRKRGMVWNGQEWSHQRGDV